MRTTDATRTLFAERVECSLNGPLVYVCTASACRACGSRRVVFHVGEHRVEKSRVIGSAGCANCCIPWLGTMIVVWGPVE